jgi:hypothetical protein
VLERLDGRPTSQYLFDDISTFTILGPDIQTRTNILYSVDRTGSRLYPHYDPGVLHLEVLHSSIPPHFDMGLFFTSAHTFNRYLPVRRPEIHIPFRRGS